VVSTLRYNFGLLEKAQESEEILTYVHIGSNLDHFHYPLLQKRRVVRQPGLGKLGSSVKGSLTRDFRLKVFS
jgi:hypothetical protein